MHINKNTDHQAFEVVNKKQFIEQYKWFPVEGTKPLERFNEAELASFTSSFIDSQDERINMLREVVDSDLPFNSPEDWVETVARLIGICRCIDGNGQLSGTTLSLFYDFGCVLRPLLKSFDDSIEWRFSLKNPKAVSYGKPMLARKNFYLRECIDPLGLCLGVSNYAFANELNIAADLLNTLRKQARFHFSIELVFPYLDKVGA